MEFPQETSLEYQVQELLRRRQVAERLRGIPGVLNSNLPLPSILAYITHQAGENFCCSCSGWQLHTGFWMHKARLPESPRALWDLTQSSCISKV